MKVPLHKRILTPVVGHLLKLSFSLQRWLIQKTTPSKGSLELILKSYLLLDQGTRQLALAKYSMPLFEGIHPKNKFNFRLEFFRERVGPNDVVIDLACGSGMTLKSLASGIRKGIGIELNPESLKICRTNAPSNIEFIAGDITKVEYSELHSRTGLTVAIASHILEHLEDPIALLRKVQTNRVLVCVPSQENWITQLKIQFGLPYLSDPTHFREYTRALLKEQLEAAGFRVTYLGFNAEGEIVGEGTR